MGNTLHETNTLDYTIDNK